MMVATIDVSPTDPVGDEHGGELAPTGEPS